MEHRVIYDNPIGRTPCGVRGLKYELLDGLLTELNVAPLAGCVD